MFLAPCKPCNRPNRQRRIADAVALLPEPAVMVDRIEATLALATEDEWKDGAAWYPAVRASRVNIIEAIKNE